MVEPNKIVLNRVTSESVDDIQKNLVMSQSCSSSYTFKKAFSKSVEIISIINCMDIHKLQKIVQSLFISISWTGKLQWRVSKIIRKYPHFGNGLLCIAVFMCKILAYIYWVGLLSSYDRGQVLFHIWFFCFVQCCQSSWLCWLLLCHKTDRALQNIIPNSIRSQNFKMW